MATIELTLYLSQISLTKQYRMPFLLRYLGCRSGKMISYFPKFDSARTSIESLDKEFNFSKAGAMTVSNPVYEAMEGESEVKLANYLASLKVELLNKYAAILHGKRFAYKNVKYF